MFNIALVFKVMPSVRKSTETLADDDNNSGTNKPVAPPRLKSAATTNSNNSRPSTAHSNK